MTRQDRTHPLFCALGPALILLLTAACSGAPEGPDSWVTANVHVAGYPTAEGLVALRDEVAADPALAGGLRLDLQLGGVLGNEKEVLEKLAFGGIQMACVSAAPLAEFSSRVGVLSLPYLFRDPEHLWRVLDGEIGDGLLDSLQDGGFVGLAWYDSGARSFYNSKRPIHRLEDLKGLKIRVQKSQVMRDMVEALGASPVTLGFKQVYTSLLTGHIDGAENNLPSYRSERHFEAARYYSYDRHSMIPDVVLVSRTAWEGLTGDEQEALRGAARRSAERQRQLWASYRDQALEEIRNAGCEVNEIDDPASFARAVEPLYASYGERYADLLEKIRSTPQAPAQ